MQLRRLAALERQKLTDEFNELIQQINYLEDLLANPRKMDFLIIEEAEDIKKRYGDERRTQIIEQEVEEFSEEDLIPHQETVITLTNRGYIKRLPLETYRLQRRGGRGVTGMAVREADAIRRLLVADTHDSLLFFTDRGRVFQLRAHEVPDSSRIARGTPVVNLIEIQPDEVITAVVSTQTYDTDFMILATKLGEVKKTPLREFESVRRSGLIAMGLETGDELVFARLAKETDDVIIVSSQGKSMRFSISDLRSASRTSGGVRGMKLAGPEDAVVGMEVVEEAGLLLTISETGLGKRTPFEDYPKHSRGGQGVLTHNVTARTGRVVAARTVTAGMELMLITTSGIVIRTTVDSIAAHGRIAQGVQVVKPGPGDAVAEIAVIDLSKSQPEVPPTNLGGGNVPPPGTSTPRRGGSRPSRGGGGPAGRRRRG
jgi:DNA gyrase subunit A